jgi:hypothetical protein
LAKKIVEAVVVEETTAPETAQGPLNFTDNTVANEEIIKDVPYIRFDKLFDDSVFDLGTILDRRYWD